MALTITPSEMQVRTALRAFLLSVLPSGVDVVLGQQNRVPEPQYPTFIVLWPLRHKRLATNLDAFDDCFFSGSIAGNVMSVGTVTGLPLAAGRQVFGPGVASNTVIIGGSGTSWLVSPTQNVLTGTFSAGAATFTMQTSIAYQVETHAAPPSPNSPSVTPESADIARTITTMFRDAYGTTFFAAQGYPAAPIVVDEGREVPWQNAEEQYEMMWVQEVVMQANFTVAGVPVEFADSATFTGVNVDIFSTPLRLRVLVTGLGQVIVTGQGQGLMAVTQ